MHKSIQFLSIAAIGLVFSSCAKVSVRPSGGLFGTKAVGGIFGEGGVNANLPSTTARPGANEADLPDEILGVRITNKQFDFPVVFNDQVEFWIKHFAIRSKSHFQVYLNRMAELDPFIRPHLIEAQVPEDLMYLAMIESGFSTRARSWANAVGVWQFIRSTGKHYGLRIDWWVDERRDPEKATKAAVTMLAELYNRFGHWELAAAAYNGGPVRVAKAIRRHGSDDFWRLARTRSLRRETKNYVPKIMAAAIVAKNAENFGFRLSPPGDTWTKTELVTVPRAETLQGIASAAGISTKLFQTLNPELLRRSTPPQVRNYKVRLPQNFAVQNFQAAVQAGKIGNYQTFRRYTIKRGDTLSQIAFNYGISTQSIMTMNGLRSARSLRPGRALILPIPHNARPVSRSRRELAAKPTYYDKKRKVLMYRVKKGDTLYEISRRYAVSIREIKTWNDNIHHKSLRPGRHLKLYVEDGRSQI